MTPAFHSKLQFEDDGGLPFTLLQTLVYVTALRNPGTIVVPSGFKTDLASIPRGLWNILPPVGRYDAAAVVHDFLYQNVGCVLWGEPFTRKDSDDVLLEAMGVLGVGRFTRWMIYAGVRVGGWKVWSKYERKQK